MTSWHGDVTDDDFLVGQCTLCDSVSRTDSVVSNSLQRHGVQSAVRPWPPSHGLRAIDHVPASRGISLSSSQRVMSCQSAVSDASLYYDVVRPLDTSTECSSAIYSQVYGGTATRPRVSAGSTAAVVQPYCHLDDNISTPGRSVLRAANLSEQRPDVRTSVGKPSMFLRRPSTSMSTRRQYDIQTLDGYSRAERKKDVVKALSGTKSTPRKYLSKSCPNIRLASMVGSQPRRPAVMSTFGKFRPVMQYDCVTDDCCSLEVEKIFGFDNDVYLGGQDADLFNGVDAMHPVSEAAAARRDLTRLTSYQTYQPTYGALQDTAQSSSHATKMRAFLSTDRSRKQERVVCETTRLNSAVCKPIITTRHHKVSHSFLLQLLLLV